MQYFSTKKHALTVNVFFRKSRNPLCLIVAHLLMCSQVEMWDWNNFIWDCTGAEYQIPKKMQFTGGEFWCTFLKLAWWEQQKLKFKLAGIILKIILFHDIFYNSLNWKYGHYSGHALIQLLWITQNSDSSAGTNFVMDVTNLIQKFCISSDHHTNMS